MRLFALSVRKIKKKEREMEAIVRFVEQQSNHDQRKLIHFKNKQQKLQKGYF